MVERLDFFLGYSVSRDVAGGPPSYVQLHALWYQFVLKSGLGGDLLRYDRRGFCRYLWEAVVEAVLGGPFGRELLTRDHDTDE